MADATVQLARVSDAIAAPPAAVWAVLADFAHPQRIAPTIDRCTVAGEGVGAVRTVETVRGLRIYERLLERDAANWRFCYAVLDRGDMPFAGITSYECTVTLTPLPNGGTGILWSSVGAIDGPLPPITEYLAALYRRATDAIQGALV